MSQVVAAEFLTGKFSDESGAWFGDVSLHFLNFSLPWDIDENWKNGSRLGKLKSTDQKFKILKVLKLEKI